MDRQEQGPGPEAPTLSNCLDSFGGTEEGAALPWSSAGQGMLSPAGSWNVVDVMDLRDVMDVMDMMDLMDAMDLMDMMDVRDVRDVRDDASACPSPSPL